MGVPIKSIWGNPIVPDQISGGATEGNYALITAGAADGIKGGGPTVDAAFLHRVTGGGQASDGPATIEVVRGNTLRWNQQIYNGDFGLEKVGWGSTQVSSWTVEDGTAIITASGGYPAISRGELTPSGNFVKTVPNHKYLAAFVATVVTENTNVALSFVTYTSSNANAGQVYFNLASSSMTRYAGIFTASNEANHYIFNANNCNSGDTVKFANLQLFDLTQMFGAGSEPSIVAEFEALYPLPYYAYDAESLLSVQMEGVESVGFNQWDGTYISSHFDNVTGAFDDAGGWRCTDKIPALPNTVYYVGATLASGNNSSVVVGCWDAADNYLGTIRYATWNSTCTATKPNTAYIRAEWTDINKVSDICVNLSDPARNGEYEPYRGQERSIPATDLRSAGSVYDELREGERITRVGVVKADTLNWRTSVESVFTCTGENAIPNFPNKQTVECMLTGYDYRGSNTSSSNISQLPYESGVWNYYSIAAPLYNGLFVKNTQYTTLDSFLQSIADAYLVFELATPTTTTIDPPLNMSYRSEQGGTETVLVPEGEMSAPVPMVVVYGSTPDGILDRSASLLAAQDGPTATANHAIGSYLTMGGQLYKVTTAIASGEAIVPGTNVTATTVMAEVLSLIQ